MRLLSLFALLACLACGSSQATCPPAAFSGNPLLTTPSDSSALQVAVTTSPQPPVRGCNAVQLAVTNAQGAPATGLTVNVVPWMPDMGHGASIQPTVTDEGNGIFALTDVYLAMPGTWQLRTTFSGSVSDSATPSFQIP